MIAAWPARLQLPSIRQRSATLAPSRNHHGRRTMNPDRVTDAHPAAIDWSTPPEYVDTASALADLLPTLRIQIAIAVDTEFMREDTCFAKLALIQLGVAGRVLLLDPVALGNALDRRLVDAMPLAVLHSPGEDYGVLTHVLGASPARCFDTQVAAPFAGLAPNLGLRELLRQVLGIELAKDQTRSDWLKRPLSADQLRYAADDVRYLLPLYAELKARVEARGQQAWCEDECRRLRAVGVDDTPEAQPHWHFRRAEELSEPAQRRLFQLLHWREQRARETNRPRNWIAPPALLWSLAERAPGSVAAIEQLLSAQQLTGGPRRASALLAALHAEQPELQARWSPAPSGLHGTAKLRLQRLRQHAELRATALGLPLEMLAPRRLLEPLARDRRLPAAYAGWRAEALALTAELLT